MNNKVTPKHKVEFTPEAVTKLPVKLKLHRAFSLPIRMPGHASAAVMVHFREGQVIEEAALIQMLLQHPAPVTILE